MDSKSIKQKAINGFLFLTVMLGLSIFLPAWSLNYWRGWIYFIIFILSCLLITIYYFQKDLNLIQRRLEAGPVAEKEISQKIIQSFASIFFIAMFITSGFDFQYHWSEIPVYLVIIADGFVVVGFWIVFRVFKENSYSSSIIEVSSEQKVISTGPYNIVRHPMYSGAFLMLIFSPIALGSYWGLIPVFGIIIAIVLRLFDEEKYLIKNLSGYKQYVEKVRFRLIPGIW